MEDQNTTIEKSNSAKKKELITSNVSRADWEAWVKQYGEGKVYHFRIPQKKGSREFYHCFLCDPEDYVVNEYMRKSETHFIESNKTLLNTVWLGGDPIIQNERDLTNSAVKKLNEKLIASEADEVFH